MATLFESNTDKPTEFEYDSKTIVNFGDVKIVDKAPWEKL